MSRARAAHTRAIRSLRSKGSRTARGCIRFRPRSWNTTPSSADSARPARCSPQWRSSLATAIRRDDAIVRAMSGNLCRCGTYPKIVRAIHSAAAAMRGPRWRLIRAILATPAMPACQSDDSSRPRSRWKDERRRKSSSFPSTSPRRGATHADLTVVGQRVLRVDAPEKVTGRARYTTDYRRAGMLYAAILRSTIARGRVDARSRAGARRRWRRRRHRQPQISSDAFALPADRCSTRPSAYARPTARRCLRRVSATRRGEASRRSSLAMRPSHMSGTFDAAVADGCTSRSSRVESRRARGRRPFAEPGTHLAGHRRARRSRSWASLKRTSSLGAVPNAGAAAHGTRAARRGRRVGRRSTDGVGVDAGGVSACANSSRLGLGRQPVVRACDQGAHGRRIRRQDVRRRSHVRRRAAGATNRVARCAA